MDVREILEALRKGELDLESAETQLKGFQDLGHSLVDLQREDRNGSPEVIYGQSKTPEQIIEIMTVMRERGQNILATRISSEVAAELQKAFPETTYHALSRLIELRSHDSKLTDTSIAIVCAGTSDMPVAEEARITAAFYGNRVETVYDCGVAGLHRLLANLDTIRSCRVVIVVAGMEGALPSVVGGLVKAPVIAVPTSVGYGASMEGVSALLTMLNSCASGVSVVNIDNGFGAGFLASQINQL
tara:strand:+ start:407 stop:1138 length:732 start_codon:yes stop_codon:yes gene_type:complete